MQYPSCSLNWNYAAPVTTTVNPEIIKRNTQENYRTAKSALNSYVLTLPSPVLAQTNVRSSTGSRAQELPRLISTKQGWFSWFRWLYYCQTQFQYSLKQFSTRLFPKVSMWPHLVPVQPQLMTTFIKLSWYHSCPSKSESWLNKQSYHWQGNNVTWSPDASSTKMQPLGW